MATPDPMRSPSAFQRDAPSLEGTLCSENEILKLDNDRLQRRIAELARDAAESHRLAHQDDLTGLPNRRQLMNRLQWAIANARQRRLQLALLFIDLDDFKGVNDRLGHLIGDQLLTIVASRIAACVRSDDIACRYGGDEFVALLPNVSDLSVALRVAHHVEERIGRGYRIAGEEIRITASVGLAIYPCDGDCYEELLRHADADMFGRKTARRNNDLPAFIADCQR